MTLNEEENDGYINVIICEDVPLRPISENQISPESSSGSNNGISSPMNLSVQGKIYHYLAMKILCLQDRSLVLKLLLMKWSS